MNPTAKEIEVNRLDQEIVELAVLVPGWQAEELTAVAQDQGLTAGQMVRRLIRDFCLQQRDTPRWQPTLTNEN
jgi:hypothetical protein